MAKVRGDTCAYPYKQFAVAVTREADPHRYRHLLAASVGSPEWKTEEMSRAARQSERRLLLIAAFTTAGLFCEDLGARLLRYVSGAAPAEADAADAVHTRGFPLLAGGIS